MRGVISSRFFQLFFEIASGSPPRNALMAANLLPVKCLTKGWEGAAAGAMQGETRRGMRRSPGLPRRAEGFIYR